VIGAAGAGLLERLRARVAARPDTEHEQAIVRLLVAAALGAYLLEFTDLLSLGTVGEEDVAFLVYVGAAATILAWVLASSTVSHLRRCLGAVADVSIITYAMWFFGDQALALLLAYVWVTLANGFRFGPRYLMISLGLSLASFLFVIAATPFWRERVGVGVGLAVLFVALSLYVRTLVKRMFDALAQSEAANQAKRRFISVVSHEMRTPLNAIIGMADLMRDTQLNREQADMLQTLRGASRAMLGLVEDVLDFSKIEAGKLVIERTDFDLHALVNTTCRFLASQAASKGVDFVVSIMPEVTPTLRGDPHHLRQVLINLAGNAVKFTEKGSVTVHVSAQSESETSVRLKFSVRDTGIGIAPEAQKRIFDSFTQGEQSTTRRFGGTGLGTTIAKQLVELMGGTIGLESAPGLGSTFWFEVEFEKQPERTAAGAGELAGARVLLVGFPTTQREALEETLAGWGAVPVAAATVDEGVQRLVSEISLAQPYHSALLYANGQDLQLAQRFRRAAPDPAPPVVLAVPRIAEVPRFAALSAGYGAVLELPFDKRQLFNVLHSVTAGEEVREGVVRLQDYARRGAHARRLRVLAADDNPTNREVLAKILERAGHAATLVADGEQVMDALDRAEYDIVLLDRNMPGMGGIEALQAIRLTSPGPGRLPVVVFSADVTAEAKRECLEAGADAFLAKPVEALRLLEELRRLCGDRGEEPPVSAPRPAEAARPAKPGEVPVIDAEILANLEELGSSPAFLEKLIGVFIADNAALMAKIEAALGARNVAEFRAHVHAMKGSAASMGATRLTRLCASFGQLSDAEIKLQSPSLLKSLRDEHSLARGELERYLSERKKSAG
jgi:two-component system sensor histidine kinase RpfC